MAQDGRYPFDGGFVKETMPFSHIYARSPRLIQNQDFSFYLF
jgi:hypothetical protein